MAESLVSPLVTLSSRIISRKASLSLDCFVNDAFSLFTPLSEKKWVRGWDPTFIFPINGEICENMVFLTPPRFAEEAPYQWIVMRFDPLRHRAAYSVSTQERIWFVEIHCAQHGEKSEVTVQYTYVGLTVAGAEKNKTALDQMFAHDLTDWQEAIEQYLGKTIN